jgi:hypothetical protein
MSWIYVIAPIEDEAMVKIGWAKDPVRRMAALQTANPWTLQILGVMAGTVLQEKALHRRLKHLRIRGEWFRREGDVLDILALLQPVPASDESAAPPTAEAILEELVEEVVAQQEPQPTEEEPEEVDPTVEELLRQAAEAKRKLAAEVWGELVPLFTENLPDGVLTEREQDLIHRLYVETETPVVKEDLADEWKWDYERVLGLERSAFRKLRLWRKMRMAGARTLAGPWS